MPVTPALALPAVVAFASLVTGAAVLPPTPVDDVSSRSVPGAPAAEGPVDGGGPVDLSLPWEQSAAPGDSVALGPSLGSAPVAPDADGHALAGSGDVAVVPAVAVTGSTSGIPSNVLVAYRRAAQALATNDPGCHLPWSVLAGIGKVESGHARGGALDASGRTLAPILGPVLSGGPGIAAIADTDGGRWDGDRTWDRAVGPMQFIPSSWRTHAVDGNGDGNADPSNIYDATLASAGYLCTGERDLSRTSDLRQAVFGYNHSSAYVDVVLAWAAAYAQGGGAVAIEPVTGGTDPVVLDTKQGSPAPTPDGRPTKRPRPTSSATPAPTPAPTVTAVAEPPVSVPPVSPTPTGSPSPGDTPTPGETGCPTPTPSPTGSPTDTPTPTETPTPTPTPTSTPSGSPTATPTPTPTDPCATPTPSPSATTSPTPTSSVAATPTPTP
jgi:hypothetical protein